MVHNLKGVQPRFPRGAITVVTGVSGSGKSSLVMEHLGPWLEVQAAEARGARASAAKAKRAAKGAARKGSPEWASPVPERVVVVDQKPIGRTPRSTPLTYCDLLGPLRDLLAATPLARERGWTKGCFSWNMEGGRCGICEGRGAVLIEMHFLSDVWMPCEACGGVASPETSMRWKGHSIADILDLTVEEAAPLFAHQRRMHGRLQAMVDVGLGYLPGQARPPSPAGRRSG